MYTRQVLLQRQSPPLAMKVHYALQLIYRWVEHWDGRVYVSFSGGKDSTVLLHLARRVWPDVPAVFADTGVEYPEIRRFVHAQAGVTILRPAMPFRAVLQRHGYPVVYKQVAQYIHEIRHTASASLRARRLSDDGRCCLPQRWRYLLDAPFEIGSGCCAVLKKHPFQSYERREHRRPLLGCMAADSSMRRQSWLRDGCAMFSAQGRKRPRCWPLAIWTDEDVWGYIEEYNVPYCEIYDLGYEHTGCAFCLFGIHKEKEPNRLQRMKSTHPKLWRYGLDALGLRQVCEYMGVAYE